jgi:hypothetical protein
MLAQVSQELELLFQKGWLESTLAHVTQALVELFHIGLVGSRQQAVKVLLVRSMTDTELSP